MRTLNLKDLVHNLRNNIRTTMAAPILRTADSNYTLFGIYHNGGGEIEFSSTLSEARYKELLSQANLIKARTMTKEDS